MAIKTYEKGSSVKLSENFRAAEFDCGGRGCCDKTPIDEKLVAYLQKIRDHFGKPVYLTGYRCPKHNAKTPNAAPNSRHTKGMAADFHIDGVAPLEIARYAQEIGVRGIGLYDTFVHIDTRENKSFWEGHGQEKRSTFGGGYTLCQFVTDVQIACGATVDGIAGPETLSKTVTLSEKKNHTHPAVSAVQIRLNALGYSQVGTVDGKAGPKFTAAVKAFQRDHDCIPDGEITAGKTTWRRLLEMR